MSIYSKATTLRESLLISAGMARGDRRALMRAARGERAASLRGIYVRSARDYNHLMLAYLRQAEGL